MKFCKKIVFERVSSKTPTIVLGIILEETPHSVKFKTKNKEYCISRSKIWSVEDTEEEFQC